MMQSQKLAVELSEKRERINVLRSKTDELSTVEKEERESLTKRLIEIEPEIRAALIRCRGCGSHHEQHRRRY